MITPSLPSCLLRRGISPVSVQAVRQGRVRKSISVSAKVLRAEYEGLPILDARIGPKDVPRYIARVSAYVTHLGMLGIWDSTNSEA